MSNAPRIARVRHELKRRRLTVARVEHVAPKMVRVALSGAELQGFTSLGFDDHVKLFFPGTKEGSAIASHSLKEASSPAMRDFTPRRLDLQAGELWIDFFLHEAGPATNWASQVTVGESIEVGGPKSSTVISPQGIDSHVFIGDETALPAISRRLEELPVGARALVVLEVDANSRWPTPESLAELEVVWVIRKTSVDAPAHDLTDRLRTLTFPPGQCFVWVALEFHAARAIRRYLREERGIEKDWIKAAAYWQRGAAGAHDRIGDDD